ncbi:MAG: FAD-dependent oxidoreductase [Proteobacteria bacterium]|nr:FAD-dependent oxidoreductase [Pseudomonadota bacterium]
MKKATTTSCDITIVGGGMAGLTLALALAPLELSITIVEAQSPESLTSTAYDGRTSAIAYGSRLVFESLGVWESMAKDSGEIRDIRIANNHSPLYLHYDHRLVGKEPMGHIIENRFIRQALFSAIKKHKNIRLLAPEMCSGLSLSAHRAALRLKSGKNIETSLLVSAEGKHSRLRSIAGMTVRERDYGQTAIVCVAKHKKHHNGVAVEQFLPAGPFAILPMGGGHHSSLVWTETRDRAPHYLAMSDADFNFELQKRFGQFLGPVEIKGNRWSYPLSLTYATRYVADRFVLVGDAAHSIHPIAGQGLNLGIRDVALLSELIRERALLGLDFASPDALSTYESRRMSDSNLMISATDGLNLLFSNQSKMLGTLRKFGLFTVDKVAPLKKVLIKHAMGTLYD